MSEPLLSPQTASTPSFVPPNSHNPTVDSTETLIRLLQQHTGGGKPTPEYPPWYYLTPLEKALLGLLDRMAPERTVRLDYPPSYDFSSRWGYSTPPHAGLIELFDRFREDYARLFDKLAELAPWFQKINKVFAHEREGEAAWTGGPVNALDLALVYGFVTEFRPKTYLEIGSGITTLFAARARQDHGLKTRIVSYDPSPRAAVDNLCDQVIRQGLEVADTSIFDTLEPGDIAFMDGSHRSFTNSDVTVFILDILPRLRPGVIIHFHDIMWPVDYPPSYGRFFWNEQYILAAYLLGAADRIKILLPSYYAGTDAELQKHLAPLIALDVAPPDTWHNGGSLWFTHV
jgi:predicted O-methyltransferase YrrM